MGKIIFFALIATFIFNSKARALSEVEVSGELDITGSIWTLPTGERGNSSFAVPSLFLNFDVPLQEDNLLVLTLEGSEEKSSSVERFDVKVREAYLDVVSLFPDMRGLRLGLIPDTWQQAYYELWNYRFLGNTAWSLTEKWKYQNYSDLGVSLMSEFDQGGGEWAVSLSNGEGAREKETGPHKEFSAFLRVYTHSPWTFTANYVRGNYEKYGEDVGLKERIQALVVYQYDDGPVVGLEFLATKDPADAIRDYGMTDGLDVLAQTGRAVSGEGGSLFTVFKTGPLAEVMLRYDYFNAVKGEDGKDLQTVQGALGYQVTEDIRAALVLDHTRYGGAFAAGTRDRSKVEFATQVLF